MEIRHTPVMVEEVLAALRVRPGGAYIDGTVGEGGHADAVLDAAGPGARLLGIDLDPTALSIAGERLQEYGERAVLVQGNFADLERLAVRDGFTPADGVVMDLGLSSLQLETAERGFSFSRAGRLDMRFDPAQERNASRLVNGGTEKQVVDIIRRFGEEPRARRIAAAIVRARPIETTVDLAGVVARALGRPRGRRTHPATRTFQALRIAVNHEMDNLGAGLEQAVSALGSGGRMVVISYHSLEDRLVKGFIRRESSSCICAPGTPECVCGHQASVRAITRRVVKPSPSEVRANPRSRSARLRVAEVL
jgi:16S rRNA (cytosine1402-N4)-methyltransferase